MDFRKIYRESNNIIDEATFDKILSCGVLTSDFAYEYTGNCKTVKEVVDTLISENKEYTKELTKAFNNLLNQLNISPSFDVSNRRNRISLAVLLVMEFVYYVALYGYEECDEKYPAILKALEILGNTDELSNRIYNYLKSKSNLIPDVSPSWSNYDEDSEITKESIFQKVYENDDMIETDTSNLEVEIGEDEALNIATCYLQDSAWSYFEGYDDENFEEDFRDWFLNHSNVELDDEMVNEYQGVDPLDRF